jgi:hypothetical protein
MNKPIGILGLGSLGSRIAIQIASAGFDVIAFDRDKKAFENPKIHVAQSESEVLENCSVVHWAIPSKSLNSLSHNLGGTVVILHDSVMNNSRLAVDERTDSDSFAIAHCLMNKVRRVFVASDGSHSEAIMRHFESIGLSPKLTTVRDHDILMAHSQGLLATIIKSGLRNELDRASIEGDLTPSGEELHRLLMNPELDWTPRTLESILANPEREQGILVTISKTEDNRE